MAEAVFDASELARSCTMKVTVRNVGRLNARIRIGLLLMRLASWVMGPRIEIEVKT